MQNEKKDLISNVAEYYSAKLTQHGESARGVDWNSEESQLLRFEKLSKIIGVRDKFSINDLGCGYGPFYDFLICQYDSFSYSGIDVSESMIRAAEERNKNNTEVRFVLSSKPDQVADYGVASGIFNVCLDRPEEEWRSYVETTLDTLNATSRLGFAFNCLTSYSDVNKMRDHLYYANPSELFDFCKCQYSRNVALLHDYDLYEFTILVRKKA